MMRYVHSGVYRDEIKVLNGKEGDLRTEVSLLSVALRTARDRQAREGAAKEPLNKSYRRTTDTD